MKLYIAFSISGLPGSGSTTCGRNLAKTLGLNLPYYAGGAARCLAELREQIGEETICTMYRDHNEACEDSCGRGKLKEMVADMMISGHIPSRPNIAAEYASFPPEFDFVIDEVQRELLAREHTAVHEGRMVPHLVRQIKDAGQAPINKLFVKIFCTATEEERMQRLQKRDEYSTVPLERIKSETDQRLETERTRYRALYGIENHVALEHFDIVLDTTLLSPDGTLVQLLQRIEDLYPGLLAPYLQNR